MQSRTPLERKHGSLNTWTEVLKDIYSGVTVGASHSTWFVKNWSKNMILQPAQQIFGLTGISKELEDSGESGDASLMAIGVGFGRTGTVSTSRAMLLPAIGS